MGSSTFSKTTFLAFIFFCSFGSSAFAQAGMLDNSFGNGGVVETTLGNYYDRIRSVALQSDGKILVTGNHNNGSSSNIALLRYNCNGSLDNTFGTGGVVYTDIAGYDEGEVVCVQADNKIVVAGNTQDANKDFLLARYQTNGDLDSSFGTAGKVITDLGSGYDVVRAMVVLPSGKILVGGDYASATNLDCALVRYNTNGTLDNTFGNAGLVTTDISNANNTLKGLAVETNGNIVVAGECPGLNGLDFAVMMYNSNGTLEATFGTGGIVKTSLSNKNDSPRAIALQADGKIVVAGEVTDAAFLQHIAAVRYNTDGSPDNTFGDGGIVTDSITSYDDLVSSVAVQPDGKILISGTSYSSNKRVFSLLRYETDGSADGSFGTVGMVLSYIGAKNGYSNSMALQTDGKIILAGYADSTNTPSHFALARYTSDITAIEKTEDPEERIFVYPNPASHTATFQMTDESCIGKPLTICNALGAIVIKQTIGSKRETVPLSLPNGIYFYQLPNANPAKLVIQQ